MARKQYTFNQSLVLFFRKIKESPSGCWEWQGATEANGYARTCSDGKRMLIHRLSYELFNGKITDSTAVVMHKCDNPLCINPFHLQLGTQSENLKDMFRKGRRDVKGMNAPYRKLSYDDARKIRSLYFDRAITQKQIAAIYGVCATTVSYIINNKRWRYE